MLSERAPDDDERFMALFYGLRRARDCVHHLRVRGETDEDGRVDSVDAAVRWWESSTGAAAPGAGEQAVREANDLMKEAVGVVGLASSDDPALWARARSWAAAHPVGT